MNRLLPTAFAIFLTLPAFGQMPAGGAPGGGRMAAAAQKAGKAYGKVVDARTGKPVDGASVIVLVQKGPADSTGGTLAANALTEPNGEFSVENLPVMGTLQLVITAIGYEASKTPLSFDLSGLRGAGDGGMGADPGAALAALNKDLGNLRLTPNQSTQLKEVTVVAQTPQFSLQGEKKVFNVEQNLNTQGGTVTDVLRNVPGVLVDADGKVTIRNSGPQILVDGRQTTLSLDQIPADAVENLEIITNPSAKYDAEGGTGGVLNVVLKKNRKQGYNGNLRAGAESRGGANLGGDFNVRSGKFNVSLNANGRRNSTLTWTNTERLDRYLTPNVFTSQDGTNLSTGYFGFARLGLDYFMTNRTTLSLGLNKMAGRFEPSERIDIVVDSLLTNGTGDRYARRASDGRNNFDALGASFGIKHLFQQPGRELTADVNYNQNTNSSNNDFTTDTLNNGGSLAQRTSGSGKSAILTAQADYTHPISKTDKIEGGVKLIARRIDNSTNNYNRNATGDYVQLYNPVADYSSVDHVFAAYVSYSGNLSAATSFQAGLRGESSDYTGTLERTGQTFENRFPVSLFPSLFVSHKLSTTQQVQFSYRRGINRPNFFQLFPFADYSDPLNIRRGNPGLRPEFTNSVEATYLKNFTRTAYGSVTAYYRHSEGLITTYQSIETNPFTNSPAVVSSYANIGSTSRYGIELTAQAAPTKWWTILANLNGYNATITSDSALSNLDNYLSGFAKLNNTFKFGKGLSAQLSGTYQSRTNLLPDASGGSGGGGRGGGGGFFGGGPSGTAQGYLDANWFVDASVRKAWGKNDAMSLTLSCNDIFGTRHFIQHTENASFVQDYDRLVNPYLFRLNFSWRFGQMDADLFRRKNTRSGMEGGQDMGGM